MVNQNNITENFFHGCLLFSQLLNVSFYMILQNYQNINNSSRKKKRRKRKIESEEETNKNCLESERAFNFMILSLVLNAPFLYLLKTSENLKVF